MFIPFGTDRNTRRSPLITPFIIGTNVVVFALVLVLAGETGQDVEKFVGWGAFDPTKPWRVWTFITCMFLHDPHDIFHLIFNMVFLWVFGCAVEDRLGRLGFLVFYLCGGIAAVFAQWAMGFMQGNPAQMIGASGAVMAVTGSFVALFPRARIRMFILFFIIGMIWVPAMLVVGIFFAIDVIGQLTDVLGFASSRTAFSAHIGGSVFGFVVAFLLLATGILKHDDFDIFYLFKQSRRRAAMRAAVAGTAGGPWANASADTSKRLTTIKKKPPRPEEPAILKQARADIGRLLREHDQSEAARRYKSVLTEYPETTLPVEQQLDVASTLYAEGHFPEAARAYELYLGRYQYDRRRVETALLLAVLYVRKERKPDRAQKLLAEIEPQVNDAAHKELLETLRGELSS